MASGHPHAAYPHAAAFFGAADPPPPHAPPPGAAADRDRILVFAKYALQSGVAFIEDVRQKQAGNPQFDFLAPGGAHHGFYRWALFATALVLGPGAVDADAAAAAAMPHAGPMPADASAAPAAAAAAAAYPHGAPAAAPVPAAAAAPVYAAGYAAAPAVAGYAPAVSAPGYAPAAAAPAYAPAAAAAPGYAAAAAAPGYAAAAAAPSYAPAAAYPGYAQPAYGAAPAAAAAYAAPQQAPLPAEVSTGFGQVLDMLTGSKDSIKASQGWFMACAPWAHGMARMMAERAAASRDQEKQLFILYLANDILFKALAARQLHAAAVAAAAAAGAPAPPPAADVAAAEGAVAAFAPFVGAILAAAARGAGDDTTQLLRVSRILDFWGEKGVFDAATMARVRREFASKDPAAAMAAAGAAPAGFAPPPGLAAPPGAAGYGYPPHAAGGAAYAGAAAGAAWPQAWPAPAGYGWPAPAPAGYAGGAPQHAPAGPAQPGGGGGGGGGEPYHHHGAAAAAPRPPGADPISSFAFPPGLIPQLVKEKLRWADSYAPIPPDDIEAAGLPPMPEKDSYLSHRLARFKLEITNHKPGQSRIDFEEARDAERERLGLAPGSDDEFGVATGSRARKRRLERSPPRRSALDPSTGMRADGSYVGPKVQRAGLGALGGGPGGPGGGGGTGGGVSFSDMYSSYRSMRSTSYHEMIQSGGGTANTFRGGR
ncbi:MAG: hypothetical protein J3K34DRAFT_511573 [Monoraphidium minutum]|nr:MAG: hypothetical protein J3K34DRAFT_511573 [Monoraphidium minutum]